MSNTDNLTQRRFMCHYTIQDSEYEYGESFLVESKNMDELEQVYQELAELYSVDDEDKSDIITNLRTDDFAMIGERAIKDVSIRDLITIRVYVRSGVIQEIQNIPPEIQIQVQNYDVEDQTELKKDSEGNLCTISIWQ